MGPSQGQASNIFVFVWWSIAVAIPGRGFRSVPVGHLGQLSGSVAGIEPRDLWLCARPTAAGFLRLPENTHGGLQGFHLDHPFTNSDRFIDDNRGGGGALSFLMSEIPGRVRSERRSDPSDREVQPKSERHRVILLRGAGHR